MFYFECSNSLRLFYQVTEPDLPAHFRLGLIHALQASHPPRPPTSIPQHPHPHRPRHHQKWPQRQTSWVSPRRSPRRIARCKSFTLQLGKYQCPCQSRDDDQHTETGKADSLAGKRTQPHQAPYRAMRCLSFVLLLPKLNKNEMRQLRKKQRLGPNSKFSSLLPRPPDASSSKSFPRNVEIGSTATSW